MCQCQAGVQKGPYVSSVLPQSVWPLLGTLRLAGSSDRVQHLFNQLCFELWKEMKNGLRMAGVSVSVVHRLVLLAFCILFS